MKKETDSLNCNLKNEEILKELLIEQRNKKEQIFIAFEEYIQVLKANLKYEQNVHKKYLIEEEIKKNRKVQEKYYVEPLIDISLEENNSKTYNKSKGLK